MTIRLLVNEIKLNINQICDRLGYSQVEFEISEASRQEFGDISCNIGFLLAKQLKRKPIDIVTILAEEYKKIQSYFVSDVLAHPSGYLNFFINYSSFIYTVIQSAIRKDYGKIDIGKNSKIVVEHTSVNPNKALHIGHVRNIVIGDTLVRILRKAAYEVNVINYVDDSGVQVADIIVGFKYGGFSKDPPEGQKFDHYCGDVVYVNITKLYETDKFLLEKRSKILQELEDGTSDIAKFGDEITRRVLEEQIKTCWRLGAEYDCLNFESQIVRSKIWKIAFEKMKTMGIIELEKEGKNIGCWVIKGESDEDKVLVRSNGTATYIAKDIPFAAWKLGILEDPFYYRQYSLQRTGRILWQTTLEKTETTMSFAGNIVITIIDSRQSRLQEIITRIMSDFTSGQESYLHLGYETVTLSSETASMLNLETGGKDVQMSGRKGLYVNADYILDVLGVRTYEEAKKRNPDLDELDLVKISEMVAIGAIRYSMIKQDLDKIITFDLTESLSLEGDTGPYLQYAYARAIRILEKAEKVPMFNISFDLLNTEYEKHLVKMIGKFDIQIEDAVKNFSPKIIAKYCYQLSVSFNAFYEHVKVLNAGSESLINARLCVVYAFKETLGKAFELLGIGSPDRM